MMILGELRKTGPRGKRVALSAEELAKAIDATDIQVITGCIKTLRRNIAQRLRRHRDLLVGDQDVVAHSEQGYQLREWITVREATAEEVEGAADSGRPDVAPSEAAAAPAAEGQPGANDAPALNERQRWALAEAGKGRQVSLLDLQRKFRVSEKTARRDLGVLTRWQN